MPNIKIRGLPEIDEESLNVLLTSIRESIVALSKVKINKKDVVIEFLLNSKPSEIIEVKIEITELFEEINQAPRICQKLAKKFEELLSEAFPNSNVKCWAQLYDDEAKEKRKWLPES